MKTMEEINSSVSVANAKYKVYLSYIGEGWNGDFNEDDPEDEKLLRVDIHEKDVKDRRKWNDEPIFSSCIGISAAIKKSDALLEAREILKKVTSTNGSRSSIEKIL